MTLTPSPLPAHPPLPVPASQAVYSGLLTDHYPWTEIIVDLSARQAQGFSGIFDAQQGAHWARFVWMSGTLLGGFTRGGQGVAWGTALQVLPRAQVSLSVLHARVARLAWAVRFSVPAALDGQWPRAGRALQHELFTGVLASGDQVSYWEDGRTVGGDLPPVGGSALTYSALPGVSREDLVAFWQALLGTVARSTPLDAPWREVCARLSAQYPCLDPFAQEVIWRGGALYVDPALPVRELRPALLVALRGVLTRLGLRLGDLDITALRAGPEWAAAGLETT